MNKQPADCLACRATTLHDAGSFPRTIADAVVLGIVAAPEAGLCAHHAGMGVARGVPRCTWCREIPNRAGVAVAVGARCTLAAGHDCAHNVDD